MTNICIMSHVIWNFLLQHPNRKPVIETGKSVLLTRDMTIESFENPESRILKSWGSRWEWLSTYFWEALYNTFTRVMLKKIITSTPVALNRVCNCSRKSCIKCTTYKLVSYLLALTVSTLPTTIYIYLVLCMLCWFLGSLYNI